MVQAEQQEAGRDLQLVADSAVADHMEPNPLDLQVALRRSADAPQRGAAGLEAELHTATAEGLSEPCRRSAASAAGAGSSRPAGLAVGRRSVPVQVLVAACTRQVPQPGRLAGHNREPAAELPAPVAAHKPLSAGRPVVPLEEVAGHMRPLPAVLQP